MNGEKRNFSIGILFIFLTTSAYRIPMPLCNSQNPQSHDPKIKVCCDGKLHDKRASNGTVFACCTREGLTPQIYDDYSQICCGPYLIPRYDGEGYERTCCEGQDKNEFPGVVVEKGQTCCGGKLYSSSDYLGCCDAMSFDIRKARCCIHEYTREAKLHNQLPNGTWDCCGTQMYDYSDPKISCLECDGSFSVKPSNFRCYDGQIYDSNKQVPCKSAEGKVTMMDIPEQKNVHYPINYGCCNNTLIDMDTYDCCLEDKRRNVKEHTIRKGDICCGNSSVKQTDMEKCCNGTPHKLPIFTQNVTYVCCGGDLTTSKRCCNGEEIPLDMECCGGGKFPRNKNLACCGSEVYSIKNEVCCRKSSSIMCPRTKTSPDHNDCCRHTHTSYNNMTQTCKPDGIFEKRRQIENLCPYCTEELPTNFCKKKQVFVLKITEREFKTKRTLFTAQMMSHGEMGFPIPGMTVLSRTEAMPRFRSAQSSYAEVPLSTVIPRVGKAHLQQNPILDSFSCTTPPIPYTSLQNVCGSDKPIFYDAARNICCNGTLYPLRSANNSEYGCCTTHSPLKGFEGILTGEVYDRSLYLCCGPHLVSLYNGWYKRKCCKGTDESRFPGEVQEEGFTCCNGRTYKLKGNESCCGTMRFDTRKYMCCDGYGEPSLHRHNDSFAQPGCCGHQTYDKDTHWCYENSQPPVVKPNTIAECRDKLFDQRTHVCCLDEGIVLEKPITNIHYPRNYICCDKHLIDENEERCCHAISAKNVTAHAIPRDHYCCGNGSVKNVPTEKCCNGIPNKIKLADQWEPHKCCGPNYVKESNCCNGRELPPEYACCGFHNYSKNSAMDCCGGLVYDTNHQVCCERSSALKFVIDKQRRDDTDCCMPSGVPFSRFTHKCTQKGVVGRPETRNYSILVCPFCQRRTDASSYCRLKNVYEIEVKLMRPTDKGSILNALLNRKEKLKIRLPFRCQCIRSGTKYIVFTNRRIKNGVLKLKSKSMIFKKGGYALVQVEKECGVDVGKKILRTIKRKIKKIKERKKNRK